MDQSGQVVMRAVTEDDSSAVVAQMRAAFQAYIQAVIDGVPATEAFNAATVQLSESQFALGVATAKVAEAQSALTSSTSNATGAQTAYTDTTARANAEQARANALIGVDSPVLSCPER